jgi:hypothetical protein
LSISLLYRDFDHGRAVHARFLLGQQFGVSIERVLVSSVGMPSPAQSTVILFQILPTSEGGASVPLSGELLDDEWLDIRDSLGNSMITTTTQTSATTTTTTTDTTRTLTTVSGTLTDSTATSTTVPLSAGSGDTGLKAYPTVTIVGFGLVLFVVVAVSVVMLVRWLQARRQDQPSLTPPEFFKQAGGPPSVPDYGFGDAQMESDM